MHTTLDNHLLHNVNTVCEHHGNSILYKDFFAPGSVDGCRIVFNPCLFIWP